MLVDWIRGRLRARKGKRVMNRPVVETALGFKFSGSGSMQEGRFEPTETAILQKMLGKADLFVNVGANFGYFVCLAQTFGVRTIAVEPVPMNLELLRKNLSLNGFGENVEVVPAACGEAEGQAEIFGVGTGASLVPGWARNPKSLKFSVDVKRLDQIVAPNLLTENSVFLVDVEGFELEVLKGAEALLDVSHKPIWMIESGLSDHREGGELNPIFLDVIKKVDQFGYDMFRIEDLSSPVLIHTVEQSLKSGTDLVGGINFLMVPKGRDIAFLR